MADLHSRCQERGISLLAFILALIIAIVFCGSILWASGTQDPQGPLALSRGAASISVVPNVVGIKARKVDIYGSGFIPNKRVILEVVGVYKGKVYSGNDVVFAATMPNQYGAFKETLQLRYITSYRVRVGPGVYTVRARTEDGLQVTTAPLVLIKAKKK